MSLLGIGSLLGGVASILGATKKPKAQAQGVDYKKLRRESEAAGFNPLTALMYGGSDAYTRTYGPSMSRLTTVGQAMSNFAQQQFDMQTQADRLALDRDYFGLERRRVEMDERVTAQNIAATIHGPVFGPSSRVAPTGSTYYRPHPERYKQDLADYGPAAAGFDGFGRWFATGMGNVASLAGNAFSYAWNAAPSLPSASSKATVSPSPSNPKRKVITGNPYKW